MVSLEYKANYFVSLVPRTNEVDTTGENSGFEYPEEESKYSKPALFN
jgi:hypothetical protein